MMKWSKFLKLTKLMILEDYRMQAAIIGKSQFLFFPTLIAIFALVISLSSTVLLESVPMDRIYFLLHMVIIIYGFSTGTFALFGEQIAERRFGQVNLLLSTPNLQPIDFKTIFMVFYIKDILLYFMFSIIPIILGISLSIPFTGFKIASVMFLFLTISLSFLFGISFSFFISSIYVRWRNLFAAIAAIILAVFAGGRFTDWYEVENIIPSLMFQYTLNPLYLGIAILLILFFSIVAINLLKVGAGKRSERYEPEVLQTQERLSIFQSYSTFMAKEWLDLRRSRTLTPVVGSYVGPLVFLAVILWIFRTILNLPLDFNIVFYAGMIGFFGVTIYSWLNVIDAPDLYQVLPVKVPQVIKAKLLLFALLTYAIATVFIIILSILYSELELLWLAFIVAYVTTTYTVIVTAYLTGLRTNVYLFDARILMKFTGLVVVPLIVITIASFLIADNFNLAVMLIGGICSVLVVCLIGLFKNLDKKWGNETFIF